MAGIEKELKEIDGMKSFLFIMDAGKLQDNLIALIKFLNAKGMSGACICLNKPFKSLKSMLESKKVNTKNILFIDTLSSSRTELKPKEGAIMISNPSELTSISLAAGGFAKSNSGKRFIIIDALSTLLIYNHPDAVAKFTRYMASLTSSQGIKLIVLTTESLNDRILPKVQPFFDRIVRLDKK
ncbi:MAG: hypothetical protein KJ955_06215 [Nanoarchaeota archaeon]|nr:hypothetical protein [Nanoarchaeota archaeon]